MRLEGMCATGFSAQCDARETQRAHKVWPRGLGPVHTGRISRVASKFILCEHSHWQQCVLFFASDICEHLRVLCERAEASRVACLSHHVDVLAVVIVFLFVADADSPARRQKLTEIPTVAAKRTNYVCCSCSTPELMGML